MAEFPELQGLDNSPCVLSSPVSVDPLIVEAPYKGVDEAFIEQEPLVSTEDDPATWDAFSGLFDNGPDSAEAQAIGYDEDFEEAIRVKWRILATTLKNNTAFYLPAAKERIVQLATRARELMVEVLKIYEDFDNNVMLPLAHGGQSTFKLSVPDDEVLTFVDMDEIGLAMSQREQARGLIRDNFYMAGKLLWCAQYGANFSEVYRENRNEYQELSELPQFAPPGETEPGMGLAPPPEPVPSPLPEFAPLPPTSEPAPPPEESPTGTPGTLPLPQEPPSGGQGFDPKPPRKPQLPQIPPPRLGPMPSVGDTDEDSGTQSDQFEQSQKQVKLLLGLAGVILVGAIAYNYAKNK